MNMRQSLITIALVAALSGCGESRETDTTAATPAGVQAPATGTGAVAFEPAYPEEVSTETLSAEDAAQQKVHAHDGEDAHTHEEETEAGHGHPH